MKRWIVRTLAMAGAAAPLAFGGVAGADTPGPVYFSAGTVNCSIADDGSVGCDLATPTWMSIQLGTNVSVPVPFPVREVVIDVPWAPAHPGFDAGTPHTLPGGNPDISTYGQSAGSGPTAGPAVSHAGSTCAVGFHGSFSCDAKGHHFFYYEAITGS
ncbi:hypothetical protein J2W56_003857 [Nocardia kruczakiae]|uniref:Ig-like domain-containing protein n=1 Tax=Nocardia kruczakiae TaxID=261477 RepID=A0ABU1XHS9_9NOCA|nr:hypothetical protein [Nocardia kruczakiae]MDR7170106.1 hypothetical protein [Nocardia kruczakiae]